MRFCYEATPMLIDHVVLAVPDLGAAAARLLVEHRLVALPGGAHPQGTRNMGVPLKPPQYLELLCIGDRTAMERHSFGRLVLGSIEAGGGWFTWAVRADDIEAVAIRTALPIVNGSIAREDGSAGNWRMVMPPMDDRPHFPFFIQYDGSLADELPRRQQRYDRATSPATPGSIAWIEVGGDESRLREWIGGDVPLRFVPGAPGLRAVAIESPTGEIVIR